MTIRTIQQTVFFQHPFRIKGYNRTLPAGSYIVDFEEEQLDSIHRTAFRQTQASLQLPPDSDQPGITQRLEFDPNELDIALMKDIGHGNVGRRSATAIAIDRAENEGLPSARAAATTSRPSSLLIP